jgi:phenylalanyl-tRNA synthetase beta chain
VAHNQRRQQRDVRLFEIGNRFSRSNGESRALAAVWTGAATATHWSGGARDVDFFDIKGLAERVCDTFGIRPRTEPVESAWLVAGRAAALSANDTRIGVLGQVLPAIAEQHGATAHEAVYALEIDLDAIDTLGARRRLQVEPLPRFPSVTRDIAILVDDTLAAATLRDTVRAASPATLLSVAEFDRYQGKGIPEGKVSLALRLMFQSPDRTLTDADVQSAMDAVLAALKDTHGAVQR